MTGQRDRIDWANVLCWLLVLITAAAFWVGTALLLSSWS